MHVRCAGPNPSLLIVDVHNTRSFVRSVSMDTWQADQIKRMTVSLTQHPTSNCFLTEACSWEETVRF